MGATNLYANIDQFKEEYCKFLTGNKSAGVRARKNLMIIRIEALQLRKDITAGKNLKESETAEK